MLQYAVKLYSFEVGDVFVSDVLSGGDAAVCMCTCVAVRVRFALEGRCGKLLACREWARRM